MMDTFERAILKLLSPDLCGIDRKDGSVCLGVDSSKSMFLPLETVSQAKKSFNFYLGASGEELLQLFINEGYHNIAEELFLGWSNYCKAISCSSAPQNNFDYARLIKCAGTASYPRLEKLSLGEFELFFNADPFYGYCGDITPIVSKAPQLKELYIAGEFLLTEKLHLNELRVLNIHFEDYMLQLQDPLAFEKSIEHVLSSTLPKLETLSIYYGCEDNPVQLHLPKNFLLGENTPHLRRLELFGEEYEGDLNLFFDKEQVRTSPLVKREGFRLFLE